MRRVPGAPRGGLTSRVGALRPSMATGVQLSTRAGGSLHPGCRRSRPRCSPPPRRVAPSPRCSHGAGPPPRGGRTRVDARKHPGVTRGVRGRSTRASVQSRRWRALRALRPLELHPVTRTAHVTRSAHPARVTPCVAITAVSRAPLSYGWRAPGASLDARERAAGRRSLDLAAERQPDSLRRLRRAPAGTSGRSAGSAGAGDGRPWVRATDPDMSVHPSHVRPARRLRCLACGP